MKHNEVKCERCGVTSVNFTKGMCYQCYSIVNGKRQREKKKLIKKNELPT
jgi:ribosomal protein L37E